MDCLAWLMQASHNQTFDEGSIKYHLIPQLEQSKTIHFFIAYPNPSPMVYSVV